MLAMCLERMEATPQASHCIQRVHSPPTCQGWLPHCRMDGPRVPHYAAKPRLIHEKPILSRFRWTSACATCTVGNDQVTAVSAAWAVGNDLLWYWQLSVKECIVIEQIAASSTPSSEPASSDITAILATIRTQQAQIADLETRLALLQPAISSVRTPRTGLVRKHALLTRGVAGRPGRVLIAVCLLVLTLGGSASASTTAPKSRTVYGCFDQSGNLQGSVKTLDSKHNSCPATLALISWNPSSPDRPTYGCFDAKGTLQGDIQALDSKHRSCPSGQQLISWNRTSAEGQSIGGTAGSADPQRCYRNRLARRLDADGCIRCIRRSLFRRQRLDRRRCEHQLISNRHQRGLEFTCSTRRAGRHRRDRPCRPFRSTRAPRRPWTARAAGRTRRDRTDRAAGTSRNARTSGHARRAGCNRRAGHQG